MKLVKKIKIEKVKIAKAKKNLSVKVKTLCLKMRRKFIFFAKTCEP